MQKTLKIKRPKLFSGQQSVYRALEEKRFIVLNAGRRWGKDYTISRICIDYMLKGKEIGLWSPELYMTEQIYTIVCGYLEPLIQDKTLIKSKNNTKNRIQLKNGGLFEGWHTKYARQGRGKLYDLAVVNEVAFCKEDFKETMWHDNIRPTLSTKGREGKGLFSSTPLGSNFFEELAHYAQLDKHSKWQYFHFKSVDSPYVSEEEVEEARADMPPAIFARNYLASFENSDANQLIERQDFRNLLTEIRDYSNLNGFIESPLKTKTIYIGVDFCGDSLSSETADFNSLVFRIGNFIFDYELNKLSQGEFIDYIVVRISELLSSANEIKVICDHVGVGSGSVKQIQRKLKDKFGDSVFEKVVVKGFSNKIVSGGDHGIKDANLYFNQSSRVYWLLRRAIKNKKLFIVRNNFSDSFEEQFVKVEFGLEAKGQETVIRVFKKGKDDTEKSPDLPDALVYSCDHHFLKHLIEGTLNV